MRMLVAIAVALLTVSACAQSESQSESQPKSPAARPATADAARDVRARLAEYAAAAAAVDAERSAAFFTPTGTLFEPGIPPIVSPDSIRAFIRSFPGVVVDTAMLRADTVEVFDDTALVWGTYYEKLRFAGQPPSAQYGRFVMEWKRDSTPAWRIEKYYRVPLPPTWHE
jgi:ketosteroid isomerase-like protein